MLSQAGKIADATTSIKAALDVRDDFPDAHLNLGIILAKTGNNTDAEQHFLRAVHYRPTALAPHVELARLKRFGNDPQALLAATAAALRIAPDNALLHVMEAEALFAQSRLREAWRAYRFRFQSGENTVQGKNYPLPLWQGETLAGRTLLIWTEQAPGDEIMYANMLPDVIAATQRCVVQCSARVAPLFRRSFPGAEIVSRDLTPEELRGIDFHSPIGNLGEWLRPDIGAFPTHAGYLRPDPGLRDRLRTKYANAAHGKLIVGVSWRSGRARHPHAMPAAGVAGVGAALVLVFATPAVPLVPGNAIACARPRGRLADVDS